MEREKVNSGEVRLPFELEVDIPSGYRAYERAGLLLYPSELVAISNWDVASAKPSTVEVDGELPNGWPRLEVMPADGVLLWIVVGDVVQDNEVMPWESGGPLGVPGMTYLAPREVGPAADRVNSDPQPLSDQDRRNSRWPGLLHWNRVVPLAGKDGEAEAEPLYLQLFAFAGERAGFAAPLANMTSSIGFSYT
jgi:hypothetical protein